MSAAITHYNRLLGRDLAFPAIEPPPGQMRVTSLDVDMTEECTLRCTYCFKGKLPLRRTMSFETAQESIRWLVRHSGQSDKLHVAFLGGEPMLAFDMLQRWMPFAVNYCRQRNKSLTVGITTNLTVFTEEHLRVFRFWHIGIHSSIDGIPQVQDACRVFPDGRGSSRVVEANLPRILRAWRTTHARSTIVPETVEHVADSFEYFIERGFLKIAFSLAGGPGWENDERLRVLDEQVERVLRMHAAYLKNDDRYYVLSFFERYMTDRDSNNPRRKHHCGAGRGLLHVDADGFLWPCHRFNGVEPREEFVLGHVFGGFHPDRRQAFLNIHPDRDLKAECADCEAVAYCGCPCVAASWQENGDLFAPGTGYCKAVRVMYAALQRHEERLRRDDPPLYERLMQEVRKGAAE